MAATAAGVTIVAFPPRSPPLITEEAVATDLGAAVKRARTVLERRPDMGPHDDAAATVRWERGTRIVASHANGTRVETDMPKELGGSGDRVSPGWMFRSGVAACAATTIAMHAAEQGIRLTHLEVQVGSRSDTRGLLGMKDAEGAVVFAGPFDVRLHVRIGATNATPLRLRELVMQCQGCAPIGNAVTSATPVAVQVEAGAA